RYRSPKGLPPTSRSNVPATWDRDLADARGHLKTLGENRPRTVAPRVKESERSCMAMARLETPLQADNTPRAVLSDCSRSVAFGVWLPTASQMPLRESGRVSHSRYLIDRVCRPVREAQVPIAQHTGCGGLEMCHLQNCASFVLRKCDEREQKRRDRKPVPYHRSSHRF